MCHHPSVGKMCRYCVDWQLWCPGHRTSDCDSCWLTLPLPKTWRPPVTYHGHEGDGLTLHTMSKHWLCWWYKKQVCMWSRGVRICENPLKVIGIFFINVQISITDLSTSSHSAVNVTQTALHQDRRDCHPSDWCILRLCVEKRKLNQTSPGDSNQIWPPLTLFLEGQTSHPFEMRANIMHFWHASHCCKKSDGFARSPQMAK